MLTMELRPITEVAAEAGLEPPELQLYGSKAAKVNLAALARRERLPDGRVILITAINPTPAGEGKTVTAIALAQALRLLDHRAIVCLREPSMGPVFGLKGGATGGGRCTVEPSDDINLHFTGDLHAVTSANNLLAAMLDDHMYRGRDPQIDVRRLAFHRVLDVNDRALRGTVVGLGSVPREERFDITAASEVMAILGLARDFADLRRRLGSIIVGTTRKNDMVTADDLHAAGAMAALLRDALHPNLVQTQEGGPAFVHTGPFANIAHGTSSLVSLLLAQKLAEFAIVEAGFGADLGAEKFVNLVGAHGGPHPQIAVVVVSLRALKYHGGIVQERLSEPDAGAVRAGLAQLWHHIRIVERLQVQPVVCINRFSTDTSSELGAITAAAAARGVPVAISTAYTDGGEGALQLAELVREVPPRPGEKPADAVYTPETPPGEKIVAIAREVYGAVEVTFSEAAQRHLEEAQRWGMGRLPVCIAKTQYSITDDPHVRGIPEHFAIHIRDVEVRGGAGFVLALAGDIMTMPALPPRPNAWAIELGPDGAIVGVSAA